MSSVCASERVRESDRIRGKSVKWSNQNPLGSPQGSTINNIIIRNENSRELFDYNCLNTYICGISDIGSL